MAGEEFVVMVAGLAMLWWAGDRSVRYAIELTDILGVSSFTVGFVVMSVATGLPEIMTAAVSVMQDAAGLSAGDLIGSSLVNLTLVLGLATVAAGTLAVDRREESHLLKILAVITVLVSAIFITSELTVAHGITLLLTYAGSLWLLRRSGLMKKIVEEEVAEAHEEVQAETVLAGPYGTGAKFLASLLFVLVGARLTVVSGIGIASSFGVPLETIGATIVAIGTGLPELTLELQAVKHREYALALGDIFGSALVNMTLVLGLLSVLSPTRIAIIPLLGTVAYLGVVIGLLWLVMVRNHGLERRHGFLLLALFLLYLVEEIGVVTLVYGAL